MTKTLRWRSKWKAATNVREVISSRAAQIVSWCWPDLIKISWILVTGMPLVKFSFSSCVSPDSHILPVLPIITILHLIQQLSQGPELTRCTRARLHHYVSRRPRPCRAGARRRTGNPSRTRAGVRAGEPEAGTGQRTRLQGVQGEVPAWDCEDESEAGGEVGICAAGQTQPPAGRVPALLISELYNMLVNMHFSIDWDMVRALLRYVTEILAKQW